MYKYRKKYIDPYAKNLQKQMEENIHTIIKEERIEEGKAFYNNILDAHLGVVNDANLTVPNLEKILEYLEIKHYRIKLKNVETYHIKLKNVEVIWNLRKPELVEVLQQTINTQFLSFLESLVESEVSSSNELTISNNSAMSMMNPLSMYLEETKSHTSKTSENKDYEKMSNVDVNDFDDEFNDYDGNNNDFQMNDDDDDVIDDNQNSDHNSINKKMTNNDDEEYDNQHFNNHSGGDDNNMQLDNNDDDEIFVIKQIDNANNKITKSSSSSSSSSASSSDASSNDNDTTDFISPPRCGPLSFKKRSRENGGKKFYNDNGNKNEDSSSPSALANYDDNYDNNNIESDISMDTTLSSISSPPPPLTDGSSSLLSQRKRRKLSSPVDINSEMFQTPLPVSMTKRGKKVPSSYSVPSH